MHKELTISQENYTNSCHRYAFSKCICYPVLFKGVNGRINLDHAQVFSMSNGGQEKPFATPVAFGVEEVIRI